MQAQFFCPLLINPVDENDAKKQDNFHETCGEKELWPRMNLLHFGADPESSGGLHSLRKHSLETSSEAITEIRRTYNAMGSGCTLYYYM